MARDEHASERGLGPLEAEVMGLIWKAGRPVTVRDLLEELNRGRDQALAYTTAMTVMTRLVDKGALERRRAGRGYLYEAAVSDTAGLAVRQVLRQFGDAAVAHFVDEAKTDPDSLRRLRRLLAEE